MTTAESVSFLHEPDGNEAVAAVHGDYVAAEGYVSNYARIWCWRPEILTSFAALRSALVGDTALSPRDVAVLVVATASTLGDSYCSLAWGEKLAQLSAGETAAAVVTGSDEGLTERESALAAWARQVVRDANGTSGADIERLREAGLSDREIFEATAWIGLRLGFSTVNDALGIRPDRELADRVPPPVAESVTFGRPPAP
jgi:uncharacterized peroxidase-related enzyme